MILQLASNCKVIFLLVFSFHHSVLESLLMPDLTSSLLPTTSHHLHNKQIIRLHLKKFKNVSTFYPLWICPCLLLAVNQRDGEYM